MSITQALSTLKLLDKRIYRKVDEAQFVGVSEGGKAPNNFNTVEELEENANSEYDALASLINQRSEIKKAIVMSNAKTMVSIGGVDYTVAEAIEKKTSIAYDQLLLSKMKRQYRDSSDTVNSVNEAVKERLDRQLEVMLGKEGKSTNEATDNFAKSFKQQNEAILIDPLNIRKAIEKIETEIEDFVSEVDFVLSTSNSINTIEISG